MIIDKKTMNFISKLLKLPIKGDEQDWAIEFADQNRIFEFITILLTNNLSFPEKYAIVSLVLSSYDDYVSSQGNNSRIWRKIIKILDNGEGKYDELLNYWAIWKENDEKNWFSITPLIRKYIKKN